MIPGNLLKSVKITRLTFDGTNYLLAAGTTDALESDALDMSGYDGVLFLALTGDNANTAVLKMEVEGCASSGGSYTLYDTDAASTFTMDATNGDYKQLAIDVVDPVHQFLKVKTTRATANIVLSGLIAIQYNGSKLPITQAVTAGQFMVAPTCAVSPTT